MLSDFCEKSQKIKNMLNATFFCSYPCFKFTWFWLSDFMILQENADLIVSLWGAMFFDQRKKGMDQIMSSMGLSKSSKETSLKFTKENS